MKFIFLLKLQQSNCKTVRKKIYDVTKLLLVKSFAEQYVKKNGKVGVTRQYIENLIDRNKNKGFEAIDIDGVRFISVLDPKIIGKPSKEIEKIVKNPPVSKIEKQKVNELLKNEELREELIKISEQNATKESVGKKAAPAPENQLSMF
jgi:hypothetical protein